MKHFKVTKHFQGGSTAYYASMPSNKKMRHKTWTYQLQEWGERTDGGYNYGWRIHAVRVNKIPSIWLKKQHFNAKFRTLKFNEAYLEPVKKT